MRSLVERRFSRFGVYPVISVVGRRPQGMRGQTSFWGGGTYFFCHLEDARDVGSWGWLGSRLCAL